MARSLEPESDAERRSLVRAAFEARFGRTPELWVRAPGRVDVMGSHTDYNEGWVLTLSIDRDTWLVAAPRQDGRVCAESLNLGDRAEFPLEGGAEVKGWAIYLQAVARVLADAGHALRGCDVVVHGTLPIASGLSSSASLEAAAGVLFGVLGDFAIEPVQLARLCQRAENEVVGVSCGILDQYSSILGEAGSALLLDCRHLVHEYAPIPEGLRPVICDTRVPRTLVGSAYDERRADCEAGARALARHLPGVRALRDVGSEDFERHERELDERIARRCRFVIEENQRVLDLAAAFRTRDHAAIGALCEQSFAGARDLYEICVPAMEAMHAAASGAAGSVGVRQAGAGFGGCLVALVEADGVPAFVTAVERDYEARTGRVPAVLPVRSAPGAGRIGA